MGCTAPAQLVCYVIYKPAKCLKQQRVMRVFHKSDRVKEEVQKCMADMRHEEGTDDELPDHLELWPLICSLLTSTFNSQCINNSCFLYPQPDLRAHRLTG